MTPHGQSQYARRESTNEFIGVGCIVQGFGLILPFVGFYGYGVVGGGLGLVVTLVLFIVGSRMSRKWRCGACKNPLAGDHVRMCPTCRWPLG